MEKATRWQCAIKILFALAFTISLLACSSKKQLQASNTNPYEDAPKPNKKWPPVISKLTESGLPESVIRRIQKMNRAQIDSLKEDYHWNVYEDQQEYVEKIMIRYFDGHILGFIKMEPMMQSNQGEYFKTQIDVPVEWCGFDSLHQEHCVKTDEEIAALDSFMKRKDFYQKVDPSDVVKSISPSNISLLRLLETKKGRKKLKSQGLTDSINNLVQGLSGEDSIFALKKFGQLSKLSIHSIDGIPMSDSLIHSITAGMSKKDSVTAINNYALIAKAMKNDKKRANAGYFSDTALAAVTQGLTGADSITALKKYLGIIKQPKPEKRKGIASDLSDSTLSALTKGLSGEDSLNAIKSYKAVNTSTTKKGKGKKKGEEIVLLPDSSTTGGEKPVAIVAPPNKSKKKKKGEHIIIPEDSVMVRPEAERPLPPVAEKKKDSKKKKGEKIVIPEDSVMIRPDVERPLPPVVDNKKESKKKKKATHEIAPVDSSIVTTPVVVTPQPPPAEPKVERTRIKTEQIVAPKDSTAAVVTPVPEKPQPPAESKKDKKKKKAEQVILPVDSSATSAPVAEKVQPLVDTKTLSIPVTKDSTIVAKPIIPVPNHEPARVRRKVVAPPPLADSSSTKKLLTDSIKSEIKAPVDSTKKN